MKEIKLSYKELFEVSIIVDVTCSKLSELKHLDGLALNLIRRAREDGINCSIKISRDEHVAILTSLTVYDIFLIDTKEFASLTSNQLLIEKFSL